jgi:acyl carrier protein
MAEIAVSQDEIMAVFPKVAETMADALGCDVEDIEPDVSLIEGLDAESIDFLDMVFRLRRNFRAAKISPAAFSIRRNGLTISTTPASAWW